MNLKRVRQLSPYINTVKSYQESEKPKRQPKRQPKRKSKTSGKKWTVSEKDKLFLAKAVDAWKEYSQTERGIACLASLKTSDLTQAQKEVSGILDDTIFGALLEEAGDMDLKPKSFSIGLNFEVELIVGFSITLGAAVGISTDDNDKRHFASSEFLSIGVTKGLDEGALLAVQFALWANEPSDIGGYCWNKEIDLGEAVEGSGKAMYDGEVEEEEEDPDAKLLGIAVQVGVGEEDGIDKGDSYIFILGDQSTGGSLGRDGYLQPVFQSRKDKPNFLIIESVKCVNKAEAGNDEVYFTFTVDPTPNDKYPLQPNPYFHPAYDYFSMDDNTDNGYNVWNCGRSVWFDKQVFVQLWNDDLGNHQNANGLRNCLINFEDLTPNVLKTYYMSNRDDAPENDNYGDFTTDKSELNKDRGDDEVYYQLNVRLMPVDDRVGGFVETMPAGRMLNAGEKIWSAKDAYTLVYETEGNLCIYKQGVTTPIWATNTSCTNGCLSLQEDGNLVIDEVVSNDNQFVWSTGTTGTCQAAYLTMQEDGDLVLFNDYGIAVWHSNTKDGNTGTPAGTMLCTPGVYSGKMYPGEKLMPNQMIKSENGQYHVVFSSLGDLCLQTADNATLWNTDTSGASSGKVGYCTLQTDGKLVIYDAYNNPIWSTLTTDNCKASYLTMKDDGNLVLYNAQDVTVWHSATAGGQTNASHSGTKLCTPGVYIGKFPIGSRLDSKSKIVSENGAYTASCYDYGRLFVTNLAGENIFIGNCTYEYGAGYTDFQDDGNLVTYNSALYPPTEESYVAVWDTKTTDKCKANSLVMQDDGDLVLFNTQGKQVWHSDTANGKSQKIYGTKICGVYTGRLPLGSVLYPNDMLKSATMPFQLVFQPTGILQIRYDDWCAWGTEIAGTDVTLRLQSDRTWQSNLPVTDGYCALQEDGNLVVYNLINGVYTPVWETSTIGDNKAAYLVMEDSGDLVLYNEQDVAVWHSNSENSTGLYGTYPGGVKLWTLGPQFPSGMWFNQCETFKSQNGEYQLIYDSTGNLCIYKGSQFIWGSGTGWPDQYNTAGYVVMQVGGNFVISHYFYDNINGTIEVSNVWSTETTTGNYLELQDDGDLVLFDANGVQLWHTDTGDGTSGTSA